ncbi:Uroporphyrinogen decarboxylase (URO-D) [Neomoorella glycerini]|uniref:Uroporphyrinogen decarboxylase (URO-D) n=1 Tax=Neomoorella glycerini TaxID=55779 RepID=A0A6I5ZNG2_9FIRM|nr:uroporphyrinogen decarboxylase family protein [Moorella glycerini]QGP91155.1 Uroporphyrinogen decarboxylase (URO-D) [Moorella glycerini]
MVKRPEELYQERLKRVEDAIALQVPDRVPIVVGWGFFPARYAGITYEEYMYDPEKIMTAAIKVHEDFEPDLAENPFGLRFLGPILDVLDFKQLRWPGRGVKPNMPYQFVEDEYMKPEEYDHFIKDPTDWIIRKYLPRICGALEPLSKIAPMKYIYNYGRLNALAPFGTEEVQQALEALKKAGEAALRSATYASKYNQEMRKRGFPLSNGGTTQAPFDTLGDYFRGTRGIMLDMYRRPEKLLKALDVLTPWMIEMGVAAGKRSGNPRIFIPLHKGSDNFMNEEQFKTFYWPTLRELIVGLVAEGMNPVVFVEADHTSRLEIMRDVPPGKVVYQLENTDIFKAKEILGDRICLRGNVPISLLCLGTPEEVKNYCRKLIDVVGKKGGFIMDSSVNVEDAKIENIRAMFDFTKEYGVYT